MRNADLTFNDYSQKPTVTENKYGAAAYNRLVKVADGVDAHDVVVMEQLKNAKNDLKVNAGWGINVNDVTTKNDGTETTTKNVISLNRNLGTNYGNPWKGEGKVTFEAGGENSMILGGAASILFSNVNDNVKAGAYGKDSVLVGGFNNLIDKNDDDKYKIQTGEDAVIVGGDTNKVTGQRSVIVGGYQNKVSGGHSIVIGGASNETDGGGAGVFGGQSNKAAGEYSSVLGGDHNEADGDWSSAIGGTTNTASGSYATTLGGINNDAKGNKSVVVGGDQNVAIGEDSTVNGGAQNTSYGSSSYAAGGMNNMAFGNASVALGGKNSNVNAKVSTGIAGGSTEEKAITALAAGHQSVVTNSGVEWRKVTQEDFDAINQKLPSWSGFTYTEPEDPYTTYVLDKVSTAVGYQSTADAPGVIAFGHDKGDVASVAKKWKQKATMEVDNDYSVKYYDANHKEISADDYYKLANADGTLNDYTQDPIGTENTTYQSAYYNRLVKAADGIDAHDAVVMEQLKPYTKSDASNIGNNLKSYTVGEDGETITEADATDDQKKTNKDDWGKALGAEPFTTGTSDAATDASTSDQLVTGKTLYNYDAPVAETGKKLNYVSANNTTGQNLLNLDRQVKTNTDTLSDVNSRSVKYDTKTENGKNVVDNTKITLAGEGGTTITNLKDGVNANDAATVGQLDAKISGVTYKAGDGIKYDTDADNNKTISVNKGDGLKFTEDHKLAVNTGKHLSVNTNGQVDVDDNGKVAANDGNLVTGKTVYDALHGGLDNITVGKDGQNGKDGSIGIAGQNGKDGYSITYIKTEQGAAGVDGKDGITRVVYQDKDGNGKHAFATLDDGLKFKGDDSTVIAKKLNEQLNITGGADSTKLTDKNIGVNISTDGLKIQLAKNLAGITSIANQTTTGKGDAQTTTGAKIDLKDDGSISVNSGKITDVKSGLTATDGTYADTDKNNVANIGDVHSMIEKEAGNTDDKLALKANVAADNIGTHITDTTAQKTNLDNWGAAIGTGAVADSTNEHANQLVTGKTVYDALHGGLDNITVGKDGQNGKDGSIGIAGQNGKDGYTMTIIKTEQGAAGVDGKDGITRVVYQDKDGNGKHTFATLDDGLKFKGDDSTVIAKKLNEQLNITGGADSTKLTDKNVGVNSSTDGLKIQLAKDLTSITSISGSTDTNGAKITLDENDKNISVNGGSIKDVASNLTKDGKIIKGSANNAASISDVQTLVQQGVDNGYTNGDGITIQKDGTSGKNVISVNQGDGLKFDNGKLAVNTGDGLTVDETTKALKIKTSDSNLKVDQNGIGLNNVITIGTSGTDAHPITIDSTKGEVSGLNNTSWDSQGNYSGSTKAATESQVAAAVKDAIKQAGDNDTHVAAGSYAVNSQHQISMNLVDKNNNNKGTVTITDVAKASEMGDVSKLDKGVQNATGTTTVVDAINNVNTKIGDQKYSQSNTSGSNKYVQDADSITSAIGKLDGAIQTVSDASSAANNIQGGDNIDVTDIKDNNDKVTGHQVSLKADISLNSVTTKTTTTDTLTVNKSANIGGVTIENKTISGLDDTKIEKDSKKAVNAGTIYNELRPATDGTYIKSTNTTAQNLTSLDTQVRATHDLINSDGKTIKIGGSDAATKIDVSGKDSSGNSTTHVITGVQTDPQDAASAANVGYVNDVTAASTQQVYRDMNRAYGSLNNNINRAAAGSNALAALHPLDFDPADKASFAVGYGHYRNANAAAVGAFYQPNANTMVNMGVSLGNGDPGFNAGVSFKIGKGSAYNGVSKAEMAQTIHDQATEISAIKADDAAKDKRIDALEKENQEMKKQIQEILARLNG